jgi:hypothetical protein
MNNNNNEDLEFGKNGPPYFFRYRTDSKYTLDEIENNYIYFSTHEKLNDPFDSNYNLINLSENPNDIESLFNYIIKFSPRNDIANFLQELYRKNQNDFRKFILEFLKPFFQKFGIACFSTYQANLVLWATYANNHQGICIQYSLDYDREFFKHLTPIEYVESLEKINYMPQNEFEAQKKLFFKKAEVWKHESELRLVKEDSGKHEFNPIAVRSIAFGLRTKDEFKKEIIKIVSEKANHIKIYNSELLEDSYGLRFTQYEVN